MSKSGDARKALGRGLSALLPPRVPELQPPDIEGSDAPTLANGGVDIAIDEIIPNPFQPRVVFQPEKLEELAQSIRENGIIQPVVVQKAGDRYQLVAGERRWRAARLAGLATVPAVVRDFVPDRLLEVALIENIQREDLNPIEVAEALDRLVRDHQLSHDEVGKRTGKDRSTVTNLLRLLKLPKSIQVLVAEQQLSMGHARALVSLSDEQAQGELARRAASQSLSVRQLEKIIQALPSRREVAARNDREPVVPDANVAAAAKELEALLGTRVRIVALTETRGKIEIDYFSADELDRLYNVILGSGAGGRS